MWICDAFAPAYWSISHMENTLSFYAECFRMVFSYEDFRQTLREGAWE